MNSSAAEVRNSAVELTATVLTRGPSAEAEVVVVAGLAFACAALEDVVWLTGVVYPVGGPEPGAC